MADDIIVRFKPMGDRALVRAIEELQKATEKYGGTIPKANKEAMKLTAQLKAQGKSWKQLNVSTKTLQQAYRGNITALERMRVAMGKVGIQTKGMIRNNRLLDHSFATMRSHMLLFNFAMGLGVRQLSQLAKQTAKVESMEKAFNTLSGGSNNAAISMTKLKLATDNTMSEMELFEQANSAMVLGVTKNSDEMSEMFDMAQRLGRALGVDTKRSIESIVTGLGRQSVKMLDNIGIVVKSNEAYEDYANELGKSVDQLTDGEKRQAFFNAALEAGRNKVKSLGPETKSTQDSFDRFGATLSDVGISFGKMITPSITKLLDDFSDWVFNMNAGPMEKLVKNLSDAGIEVTKFTGLMKQLEKEKAQESMDELTTSSTEVLDVLTHLGNKNDVVDFLDDFGLSLTTLSGKQSGFATALDISSGKFDDLSGLFIDFTDVNSEKLNIVFETMIQNLEKATTAMDEEIEKNGEASVKTEATVKALQDKVAILQALLVPSLEYSANLDVINGKLKEETDLKKKSNGALIINEDLLKKLEEAYDKTTEAQLLKLEADIAEAEQLFWLNQLTDKQEKGLDALIDKYNDLIDKVNKKANADKDANKIMLDSINVYAMLASNLASFNESFKGSAIATATLQAIAAGINIQEAATDAYAQAPIGFKTLAAAAVYAGGIARVANIYNSINQMKGTSGGGAVGGFTQYEQGGYVGGRPHSQGGTIIEAERGEFVMSRNAVESIGLETLNMMNEGGGGAVNITVTGNVMTQDFVEGELAESIKEAVRRGSDFGIG